MKTIIMITLQSKRVMFFGVLIAIIITTASFQLATLEHNVLDEFDSEHIEWDFDSSIQLSQQMATYSNQLLGITVVVGQVIGAEEMNISAFRDLGNGESIPIPTFIYRPVPYFAHDASRFRVYYYSDEYELHHRIDPSDSFYKIFLNYYVGSDTERYVSKIDPSTLPPIQLAFANDISDVTTLVDIDTSDISNMKLLLEPDSPYWEINLIYKDGTKLQFYVLDNMMILRIIQLDEYFSRGNAIYTGHYRSDGVYPTYVSLIGGDTILPSFTQAVNHFINGVVGSYS